MSLKEIENDLKWIGWIVLILFFITILSNLEKILTVVIVYLKGIY